MGTMDEEPILTGHGTLNTFSLLEHEIEVRRMGVWQSNVEHIRYDQIAQVALRRGLLRHTLIIESRGGHTLVIKGLPTSTAEEAHAIIRAHMDRALGQAEARNPSVAMQIRELAELRNANIITEAEFEAKKRELLDRM